MGKSTLIVIFFFMSFFGLYGQKAAVMEINFEENSYTLTEYEKAKIKALFKGKDPNDDILYVDLFARSTFNPEKPLPYICEKRINAVKEIVKSLNISSEKIKEGADYNATKYLEDLSKNRIVELTFVPKSKYDKTTLEKILERERIPYNSANSSNSDIYATSDQIKTKLSSLLKSDTLTINNLKDTLVVLSNGVSFYIPPFSFVGVTEENPNLEITLKSITDHQDLLYENISTVTPRGEALETAGIFYLEAINHKEKSSRLLPKSSLIVFFSSKHVDADMDYYYGITEEAADIMWTRRRNEFILYKSDSLYNKFSCYVERPFTKCRSLCNQRPSKESNYFTKSFIKYLSARDPKKQYSAKYECKELRAFDILRDKMKTTKSIYGEYFGFQNGYMFRLNRSGWNNVEKKLTGLPGSTDLIVVDDTKEKEEIIVKLILADRETVFSNPNIFSTNIYEFKAIPPNSNAFVVAFKEINGQPFVAVEPVITGINDEVKLSFRPFSDYEGASAYVNSKINPEKGTYFQHDDY